MGKIEIKQSFSGLEWIVQQVDDRNIENLVQTAGVSDFVARLLTLRGIASDSLESFLNPKLKTHLPNPFSLLDMERACKKTACAIMNRQSVAIMGDYDVDGATSTALLKLFLQDCGCSVLTYIPDRENGYGPSSKKFEEFYEKGCRLCITVDCGTTAFEPIEFGTTLGMEVLILDHHDAEEKLPNAYAVVNPKRLDEPLNHCCKGLAAVGVVFLFVVGVNKILRENGFYTGNITEPNLIRFLDLVALGTVCDVMPLCGVNRLFVKTGLQQMRLGQNKGINALCKIAELSEPPSAYHLGYVFGPRINACGRIGKSDLGMELLSTKEDLHAGTLAGTLEELNAQRREIEAAVFLDAVEQVESQNISDPFLLVVGEGWHQGVIGIVAGRLKDRYKMPVFVLSVAGDEVKGSARSVQGVDLGTIIMNALTKGVIEHGGGHPKAAGFSLKRQQIDGFKDYLKAVIQAENNIEGGNTQLSVDAILSVEAATPDCIKELSLLEPFGEGNPEPRFLIPNVFVNKAILLKNGHISCVLNGRNGGKLSAIAFRCADTELGTQLLKNSNRYFHFVGTLKHYIWKGVTKTQLQIQDGAFAE